MRTIIGLIIGLSGLYIMNKGSGLDKPFGLGIGGVGMLILPGGTDPFLSAFIPILVIIAAFIWGLLISNK